jgi:hypothetical protein
VYPKFYPDLSIHREDLNILVRRHIQAVVSASPSKALSALATDASELISSGMVTFKAKLAGIDDDKLVSRVVEIWGFFWDQVLPYIEGVCGYLLFTMIHDNDKLSGSTSITNRTSALFTLPHTKVSSK